MITNLNTDIVHEIYVNDNEFYILLETPYIITSDVNNRNIFVSEICYDGFKKLNPKLNIYPYKFNAYRITPHPFIDEYNRIIDNYNNTEHNIEPDKEDEEIEPIIIKNQIDIYCDDPDIKPIKSIKDIIYRCNNDNNRYKSSISNKFDNYDNELFNELKNRYFNNKKRSNNYNTELNLNINKRYYSLKASKLDEHIFGNGRHYSMEIKTNTNESINDLISNSNITIHVPIKKEAIFKEKWKELSDNIKGEIFTSITYSVKKYHK